MTKTKFQSTALAYFITIRAYGTWLHGDERLSVNPKHNKINTPKIDPNNKLHNLMRSYQKYPSVKFTKEQGEIIVDAVVSLCNQYGWRLFSIHVRTNHVHFTLRALNKKIEDVMTMVKAKTTRMLRKKGAFSGDQKIWSRHGSTKYINSDVGLYFTNDYVIERQGQKMSYHFEP